MKKELKIYLFRHGQTTFNREGKFTGRLDAKLTKKGIQQTKKIAEILKNKKFQVAFYTSLSRSKNSLKYILKEHPECKKLIKDDRMIERNYGLLNGTTHKSFIHKIGKKEYDLLRMGDAIENLSSKDREKIEKFLGEKEYELIHRGYDVPPPKGESFADVEKRVASFIKFLIPFMKKNKINVIISSHGNAIRLFRKIMEKKDVKEMQKWEIPYDKVFTYDV